MIVTGTILEGAEQVDKKETKQVVQFGVRIERQRLVDEPMMVGLKCTISNLPLGVCRKPKSSTTGLGLKLVELLEMWMPLQSMQKESVSVQQSKSKETVSGSLLKKKTWMTPKVSERSSLRFVEGLGLMVLDRGLDSCVHKTVFCKEKCYNKRYLRYPNFKHCQSKDSYGYEIAESSAFANLERVRLCSRGEPVKDKEDVKRIVKWAGSNPTTTFQIPTRCWREPEVGAYLKQEVLPNMRVLASIDPSNSLEEVSRLVEGGWSTMFFGNDIEPPVANSVKCPKTWAHKEKACASCVNGCFKRSQVHVWLKKH